MPQDSSIVLHINVSSGTPQMKESLPFLVSVGQLKDYRVYLWQVFDPRGGAQTISERVQRAPELDLLTQERILLSLEQLAKKHLYQEANNLIKSGLTLEYLPFARQLYSVLALHDQWLYKDAKNRLGQIFPKHQVPDFLKDWLEKVGDLLNTLAQEPPPKEELAIDRYYCACRRFVNALYSDAINHFWTACELALEKHGLDLQILKAGKSPSALELINRLVKGKSPLCEVEVTLIGQTPKPLLAEEGSALDWLRRIRNEVAHGSRPVDKKLAKNAQIIATKLLTSLYWRQKLNSYPLKPDLVEEKILQLIRLMRDSLWQ